jgi:hypothetical protein
MALTNTRADACTTPQPSRLANAGAACTARGTQDLQQPHSRYTAHTQEAHSPSAHPHAHHPTARYHRMYHSPRPVPAHASAPPIGGGGRGRRQPVRRSQERSAAAQQQRRLRTPAQAPPYAITACTTPQPSRLANVAAACTARGTQDLQQPHSRYTAHTQEAHSPSAHPHAHHPTVRYHRMYHSPRPVPAHASAPPISQSHVPALRPTSSAAAISERRGLDCR